MNHRSQSLRFHGRIALFQACLALATFGIGLSACKPKPDSSTQSPSPQPNLLAQVGTNSLTIPDFQQWVAQRPPGLASSSNSVLLDEWINRQAQIQKAIALQIDRDPQWVRSWENGLIGKLRERELEAQISNAAPTIQEIHDYYQKKIAQFTDRPRKRIAMILMETGSKMNEERRATLRQRMEEARKLALQQLSSTNNPSTPSSQSRGFGNLATQFSQDQASRYQGGDIGWITQDLADPRLDPAALEAAWKLSNQNPLSPVIESPKALYLLKWMDEQTGGPKPLALVENSIRQRLLQEKRAQLEAAWLHSLRTQAVVQIFPDALQTLPPLIKPSAVRSTPGEPPPVP